MIPKIIHYCWFGGQPFPDLAQKCIESWKKYCPEYEIKEWNESNFDLNSCDYVKEAYQAKKWAFVSDYARFWVLYHEGGLYFDTDVELIKSNDDIVEKGAFMGCETIDKCTPGLGANPGLGLGANPGLGLYKEILDFYQQKHFLKPNGEYNMTTVVEYTTDLLLKHGWIPDGHIQNIEGVLIYPPEYFCPMNYKTGRTEITSNTYSIHHYSASWIEPEDKYSLEIGRKLNRYGTFGKAVHAVIHKLLRLKFHVRKRGLWGTIGYFWEKAAKNRRTDDD